MAAPWIFPNLSSPVYLKISYHIATQQLGTAISAVKIASAVSNPQDIAQVKTFKLISNGLFDAWKPNSHLRVWGIHLQLKLGYITTIKPTCQRKQLPDSGWFMMARVYISASEVCSNNWNGASGLQNLEKKAPSKSKTPEWLQRENLQNTETTMAFSRNHLLKISNYAENPEDRLITIRASPKDRLVQLSSSNDGKIASFCFIEATRDQKDKGTTKLSFLSNQASDIIGNRTPQKKHTNTHNIIHSFIHSSQACSHWPSASECSVSAPPSSSSPLRPSGSKKSGRAPNSHHKSFRPHHDTKQSLSLSLSPFFTAKSRSNQLPFALKLADTRNTQNLANSSTAQSS
jgi:hypothetical protein